MNEVPALEPDDVPVCTFGLPADRELRLRLFGLMQARGRLPQLAEAEELWDRAFMGWFLDRKLIMASGRWAPGSLDPLRFVPGDVVAIRGISATAGVTKASALLLPEKRPPGMRALGPTPYLDLDHDVAIEQLWPLLQAAVLYEAQSYFVPVMTTLGILASHPPTPEMLAELQLPYPKVAVYFGADLAIPEELVVGASGDEERYRNWETESVRASARYGLTAPPDILAPIARRGGLLSGVVFFQDDGGGLADEVIWILACEEPPDGEGAEFDRGRGVAMGLRSRSSLNPLIVNLAAAVSWGDWHPPETTLELPADPHSSAWDLAVRSGRFRRQEPRGGFANIRVLNVQRMQTRAKAVQQQAGEGHASPVTHLRRGHWKRVRVGPRTDWSYETRWIPPVVVNPNNQGRSALRIYRLPLPPGETER